MVVPEHTVYYLEIVTPEAEATRDLYGEAYGWNFQGMKPELGNAFVAELPGGSRCGIRAPMHEQEKPTVRTYLRVTDIEQAVERVKLLGGTIALEPTEIAGHGKIAIYLHAGIEQGLWQVP